MAIDVSEHIRLDLLQRSDLAKLVDAINDPYVASQTRTIPHPYTMEDGLYFYERVQNNAKTAGFKFNFSIFDDKDVIGGIGLLCEDGYSSHRSSLGYWLAAGFRGKGIMTNVIESFVSYIFKNTAFKRLQAHTYCDNIASQKVLEKNGFLREGMLRKYVEKDFELKDVYLYSKLHPDLN